MFQILNIGERFLLPSPPQTQGHTTGISTSDNRSRQALDCKLMSWFIHCLICVWSVIELFRVETVIPDPVLFLASMTAMCCVFLQLATWGVETLLGKLAVGGVAQWHSDTECTFQNRTTGYSMKQVCELSMFSKYLQMYYGIFMI